MAKAQPLTTHASGPLTGLDDFSPETAAKRGKENFPVASWFLPRRARAGTIALYHFARHADDIADSPTLQRDEKLSALSRVDRALHSGAADALPEWAQDYFRHTQTGATSLRHGRALLSAFMQDASKGRYTDWEELRQYCMRSAAPVGRAVLELHGEWQADIPASDALCGALQILNHLQDLKSDYLLRNRIYLPVGWLENPDHLSGDFAAADVHQAINRALDKVEKMLQEAANLPGTITGFRLRAELCTIIRVACNLINALQHRDPIGTRVELSAGRKFLCLLGGTLDACITTRTLPGVASLKKAGTSFFWPIARMEPEKREAMGALYAFCRATDDAVDEAASPEEAERNLHFWRHELAALYSEAIGTYPAHPVTRALLPAVRRFGLKRTHLEGILEGLTMDADNQMLRPTSYTLDRYCYGVASCVGLLSVAIFEAKDPQSEEFAIHLGKAFQYVNILRDVREDAARGRIYLPQELLAKHGLRDSTPETITQHSEALRPVLAELGALAKNHFRQADEFLPESDRDALAPAFAMRRIYERYLVMLEAQNWDISAPRVRLAGWQKLRLALKK